MRLGRTVYPGDEQPQTPEMPNSTTPPPQPLPQEVPTVQVRPVALSKLLVTVAVRSACAMEVAIVGLLQVVVMPV